MLTHNPVLLEQTINNLLFNKDGIYLDATFGRGGHSLFLLEHLNNGKLIIMDKDSVAVNYAKENFVNNKKILGIYKSCFSKIDNIVKQLNLNNNLDGVMFDLGVSSPQLDDLSRGFSFRANVKLDMRLDQSQQISAVEWLNETTEKKIADCLYYYADEVFSYRIATNIVKRRKIKKIEMVFDLLDIIKQSIPAKYWYKSKRHPATKTFMAIRIAVNQELDVLEIGLKQAFDNLKNKGRLSIISFHSIEDRLVKKFINSKVNPNFNLPKYLPVRFEKTAKIIVKKLKPDEQELKNNPRSRSANLRVIEKL